MKKTRLQLHITPEEIVELANSIKKEFELYMIFMNYQPFSIENKQSVCLKDITQNGCRILFSKSPPILEASTNLQFIKSNHCFIGFEVGKNSPFELTESSLFCVPETENELKIANKIINRLKKQIHLGAVINNPRTHSLHISPKHKYTTGAKKLYDMGVKMSSITGGVYYELN